MSIAERRAEEVAEMKAAILNAAMSLILDHGFEHVSIRKIAQKIRYSPATIYLYFRDKEDILFHLHREGFRRFAEAQRGLDDITDPAERMHAHGRVYIRFALANPEYYQLIFMLRGTAGQCDRPHESDGSRETFEVLRRNVTDLQDAGYLPTGNADQIAFLFWSTVHGMASLIIRGRMPLSDDKVNTFADSALNVLRSLYTKPNL